MTITRYKVGAYEIATVEQPFVTEVPLDSTNVFFTTNTLNVADNTQDAIINASVAQNRRYVEASTTLTSASTTLATDTALTLTPGVGRFMIFYSAQTETTGLSAKGEIELFKNVSGIANSLRQLDSNIAGGGIGGLTGLAIIAPVSTQIEATFAAGDTLTVQYRCADRGTLGTGTYIITQRSLFLLQTGL